MNTVKDGYIERLPDWIGENTRGRLQISSRRPVAYSDGHDPTALYDDGATRALTPGMSVPLGPSFASFSSLSHCSFFRSSVHLLELVSAALDQAGKAIDAASRQHSDA